MGTIEMLSEQKIKELVELYITEKGHFLVDVKVSPFNKINVFVDNNNGIAVSDCAELSRFIESNLNRDEEDFELEVSSPGLDQPFKVLNQYRKYIGRKVDVVTKEGQKITGQLIAANEQGIELQEQLKKKVKGNLPADRHGKQLIINNQFITFEKIKETKIVISFN
jgi:ribosome maturation factor RimP